MGGCCSNADDPRRWRREMIKAISEGNLDAVKAFVTSGKIPLDEQIPMGPARGRVEYMYEMPAPRTLTPIALAVHCGTFEVIQYLAYAQLAAPSKLAATHQTFIERAAASRPPPLDGDILRVLLVTGVVSPSGSLVDGLFKNMLSQPEGALAMLDACIEADIAPLNGEPGPKNLEVWTPTDQKERSRRNAVGAILDSRRFTTTDLLLLNAVCGAYDTAMAARQDDQQVPPRLRCQFDLLTTALSRGGQLPFASVDDNVDTFAMLIDTACHDPMRGWAPERKVVALAGVWEAIQLGLDQRKAAVAGCVGVLELETHLPPSVCRVVLLYMASSELRGEATFTTENAQVLAAHKQCVATRAATAPIDLMTFRTRGAAGTVFLKGIGA